MKVKYIIQYIKYISEKKNWNLLPLALATANLKYITVKHTVRLFENCVKRRYLIAVKKQVQTSSNLEV